MTYSSNEVADVIIDVVLCLRKPLSFQGLNQMLYICNGSSFLIHKNALFNDRIMIGEYDPIIDGINDDILKQYRGRISAVDKETQDFIFHVCSIYIEKSTHELGEFIRESLMPICIIVGDKKIAHPLAIKKKFDQFYRIPVDNVN